MNYLDNIIFTALLIAGVAYFYFNIKKITRNIKLGKTMPLYGTPKTRLKNMIKTALGQSKMTRKPVAGIFHIIIYIAFVLINLELLEIIIDGIFGTHRFFAFLGIFYNVIIGSFEILALSVLISVAIFWLRRNIINLKRFKNTDLDGFSRKDANYILYFEKILMTLFLLMNVADLYLQNNNFGHFIKAGSYPISHFFTPIFKPFSNETVEILFHTFWWMHIIGILIFLNYLYYSKHLHIILAFPNTYFANLNPLGKFPNSKTITTEVQQMLNITQVVENNDHQNENNSQKFGANDVQDLNQLQLLNAYTCTECGRCTASCPANLTGKKLSPRKIMMSTRDRLEEVGKNIDTNKGVFIPDEKSLFNYITNEELWACTSCNACAEECPVNINPLSIILDLRQYLVMEQSAAPNALNNMMTNIENNGAPWPYNQQDRLNWKNEI